MEDRGLPINAMVADGLVTRGTKASKLGIKSDDTQFVCPE